MKILYTEQEFNNTKSYSKLPRECQYCSNIFYIQKRHIVKSINNGLFCSNKCRGLNQITSITVHCANCNHEFMMPPNKINKSKSGNHFCSQKCASIYINSHKTTCIRRSKLEIYLETELIKIYPNMEFLFNNKKTINSELDIYLPSLKLAFELNGIFHYEPIFGVENLNQIQNNDQRKFQACLEHGIELCIIDSSQQKYFSEKTSKKYLDIIISIINKKTTKSGG